MLNTVGHRETERALQLGHLYGADEALRVGLVDRLCPEDQVVKEAEEEMSRWLRVNGQYLQLSATNFVSLIGVNFNFNKGNFG